MIAYFTASVVGKRHFLSNYLAIIEILKSLECETISDHIIKSTESQIRLETKEERIKFQVQLEKWINSCNFMVAETSFPSISVGYEISLALYHNKPILILYSDGNPPSLLVHHRNEKLVCEKYTLETLKEIIVDFINFIKGITDTKFTFFITPEIAAFLDKIAKKEKMPKSVYLRKLIEQKMKNSR